MSNSELLHQSSLHEQMSKNKGLNEVHEGLDRWKGAEPSAAKDHKHGQHRTNGGQMHHRLFRFPKRMQLQRPDGKGTRGEERRGLAVPEEGDGGTCISAECWLGKGTW